MRLGRVRHESKYLTVRHFHAERDWGIGWMCSQLGVSRAAYYKRLHRIVPGTECGNIRLAEHTKEYNGRSRHILGCRGMASWINHFNYTAARNQKWATDVAGLKAPGKAAAASPDAKPVFVSDVPTEYPILENKQINKYKEEWCA